MIVIWLLSYIAFIKSFCTCLIMNCIFSFEILLLVCFCLLLPYVISLYVCEKKYYLMTSLLIHWLITCLHKGIFFHSNCYSPYVYCWFYEICKNIVILYLVHCLIAVKYLKNVVDPVALLNYYYQLLYPYDNYFTSLSCLSSSWQKQYFILSCSVH